MQFVNLTPFAAQDFVGYDIGDRAYDIVVMKTGYRFVPVHGIPGYFATELIEDAPVSLVLADEHTGDPASSSLACESDLAPYKPRCDVLVTGHAYAPEGHPCLRWETRLRLGRIDAALPAPPPGPDPNHSFGMSAAIDLYNAARQQHQESVREYIKAPPWARLDIDKTLMVEGPRAFTPHFLHWVSGPTQTTDRVPLRWENTFGGHSHIADPARPDEPLVDAVCFLNPVGQGWLAKETFGALRQIRAPALVSLPAPQIHYPGDRLKAPIIERAPAPGLDARQMAQVVYDHRPANYGPLGRAWAPRLALAGTYDDAWLRDRHPWLPKDFNFAYWNGAPLDQQMDYPRLYEQPLAIELQGLTRHPHARDGTLLAFLPKHRAMVFAYAKGKLIPLPMQPDTLVVDTDAATLNITWRTALLQEVGAERLEVRFETDPAAPWVKFEKASA